MIADPFTDPEGMKRDSGQASLEYAAVAFLVSLVLTGAVAITSGGLGQAVEASIRRGICEVSQGRCTRVHAAGLPPDLEVCPVARHLGNQQFSLEAGVVRLAAQLGLTVERMSDGRVRVSFVDGGTAGVGTAVGAHLRVGVWTAKGEAAVDVGAALTAGRVWVLPNAASAKRFVSRFGAAQKVGGRLRIELAKACPLCFALVGKPEGPPAPDEHWISGGLLVRGAVGLGAGPVGLKLEAVLRGALGRRVTRAGTTWFMRVDDRLIGSIDAMGRGLDGQVDSNAVISLETDRSGKPVRLKLLRESKFSVRNGLRLPSRLRNLIGHGGAGNGQAIDSESSLDLLTGSDRAAAADFLGSVGSLDLQAVLESGARLGKALDDHGVRTVRTWRLRRSQTGIGAGAALGLRLGADAFSATEDQQLVSVDSKLPGLDWLPRADCLLV